MSKSTATSAVPRKDVDQLVGRFIADLKRQETSSKTRASYRLDLLHFAGWFARTVGEAFASEAVTPTDCPFTPPSGNKPEAYGASFAELRGELDVVTEGLCCAPPSSR